MAKDQEVTPFYIRTSEGATFFVDTLEEALKEFASAEGYRLTLTTDDYEVVVRRSAKESDEQGVHAVLGELCYQATVIIRDRNK